MLLGWISVHRQLQEHWLWEDKPFSRGQAWIDLLMLANHADKKFLFGGELVEVKAGSFITSIAKLCEKWGWSNTKVVKFLDLLEAEKMIVRKSDAKKTAITIENYSIYQSCESEKTMQKRYSNDTETMQKHTNNNDNNVNNDNNLIVSKDTICRTDMQRIVSAWNDLGLKPVTKISSGTNRYDQLRKRIKDYGVEEIIRAIGNVKESDYLQGSGKNGWMITFDWFIKPNNFIKVLEGNYNDRKSAVPTTDESMNDLDEYF